MYSRRTVLRTGTGVGAVVLGASAAGCLSGQDSGDGTTSGMQPPSYTEWLYRPGTVGARQHSFAQFTDHSRIQSHEAVLGDEYDQVRSFADQFPYEVLGLSYSDLDSTLFYDTTQITTGAFSRSVVERTLERRGFERDGERAGYALFSGPVDSPTAAAVAVGETEILSAASNTGPAGSDSRDAVEATLDAKRGAVDRYTEVSTPLRTVASRLGSGTVVSVETKDPPEESDTDEGSFSGEIAEGTRAQVNGVTTSIQVVLLFSPDVEVPVEEIASWTETSVQFERVSETELTREGRQVIVTGTTETGPFLTQ